jgi:alpha,alpha-trehalase
MSTHLLKEDLAPEERVNDAEYEDADGGRDVRCGAARRMWAKKGTKQAAAVLGVVAFVATLLILTIVYSNLYHATGALGDNGTPMLRVLSDCTHPIYCTGPLLREVQMARVFTDDKTFVDMPVCAPGATVRDVVNNFTALLLPRKAALEASGTWTAELLAFVNKYFCAAGSDVYTPPGNMPDFDASTRKFPGGAAKITDPELQRFADGVYRIWPQLYKAVNVTRGRDANLSSALPLPHPFIVPGSRFIEQYYWDEYFVILGLLRSGLTTVAQRMLRNFFDLVTTFGFVPNGGRLYYTSRSQPPLLAWMVDAYVNATGDTTLLALALPILEREHQFWMDYRTPTTTSFVGASSSPSSPPLLLTQYWSDIKAPRPEGYHLDVATNTRAMAALGRADGSVYAQLRAGAETGMDYSSRWLLAPFVDLTSISVTSVVPADLNAILVRNEQLLEQWFSASEIVAGSIYSAADAKKRAADYGGQWRARQDSMLRLMWCNDTATFVDLDASAANTARACQRANNNFNRYASSAAPLAVPSIAAAVAAQGKADVAIAAIKESFVLRAGVRTSNMSSHATSQQWDGSNAWAPLQWWVHGALQNLGDSAGAADIANKWIATTYCGWNNTADHVMFEKYNATRWGVTGTGGEYSAGESGFGWTNGVALEWLVQYGKSLKAPTQC